MKVVAAIREMLAKGLSFDQALTAAEIMEAREESELEALKAQEEDRLARLRTGNRERQQRWRASVTRDNALQRVTSVTVPPPSPKKEKVPPTPPLKEKTPLPLPPNSLSDERLVIERVDDGVMCRLKSFAESWNKLAGQFKLPQIAEIKPGSMRERHALARLRDLESHDDLLNHVRGSPYLRGEINGFRATFDWIINVSNCQKIMDGNYETREERRQTWMSHRGPRS